MWNSAPPFPVVISAASGTGKTTVVERLANQHPELFHVSVSATTRAPRGNERDGGAYHFVSRTEFERMIAQDLLLEWAHVYGQFYGTPRLELDAARTRGRIALLDIDVQGGAQVLATVPEAVAVFLLPPSMEELEKRLRARGTDEEAVVGRRLREAALEIEQGQSIYDYVVVNDDLDRCVDTVWSIVRAECFRAWRIRTAIPSAEGG